MGYNLGDWEKPPLEELMHYGVKGMKWGHHKRVESTEVVNARKVYNERRTDFQKAKLKSISRLNLNKNYREEKKRASREFLYSEEDLVSAKILDRLKQKPKSKTQLKLEGKYKKNGMSDNEAAVAAYKNIRTRKIIAVTAGIAVVSLTAYGAYKFHDNQIDKIIKSGSLLQNISNDNTVGVRDAFYATNNKFDNVKYKGLFGLGLKNDNVKTVKKEIKALSDIRQASPKNAQKALSELIKSDDTFAKDLNTYFSGEHVFSSIYGDKMKLAQKSLSQGKVDKNVYEVFNSSLVDHSERMQPLANKYFNTLSKKGYNALKDVNDSKYSGFKAINPIVVFNTSGKVNVVNVTELADKEINKSLKIALAHMYIPKIVGTYAAMTSPFLGTKLLKKEIQERKKEKQTAQILQQYRKEYPNSALTNTEIIRMFERSNNNED